MTPTMIHLFLGLILSLAISLGGGLPDGLIRGEFCSTFAEIPTANGNHLS